MPAASFLINSTLASGTAVGRLFHVVDSAGMIRRSFGGDGNFRRDERFVLRRRLSPAGPRSFWAAGEAEYRLERWAFDGALESWIVRRAPWFPTGGRSRFRREIAPTPEVQAIRQDRDGNLWVVITVADSRWAEQFTDRPDDQAFNGDFGRYLDSIIEVLDPVEGRLIASTRLDIFVRDFLDDDEVYGYRLDDAGVPLVDVIRLTIERSPRHERWLGTAQNRGIG